MSASVLEPAGESGVAVAGSVGAAAVPPSNATWPVRPAGTRATAERLHLRCHVAAVGLDDAGRINDLE